MSKQRALYQHLLIPGNSIVSEEQLKLIALSRTGKLGSYKNSQDESVSKLIKRFPR